MSSNSDEYLGEKKTFFFSAILIR